MEPTWGHTWTQDPCANMQRIPAFLWILLFFSLGWSYFVISQVTQFLDCNQRQWFCFFCDFGCFGSPCKKGRSDSQGGNDRPSGKIWTIHTNWVGSGTRSGDYFNWRHDKLLSLIGSSYPLVGLSPLKRGKTLLILSYLGSTMFV